MENIDNASLSTWHSKRFSTHSQGTFLDMSRQPAYNIFAWNKFKEVNCYTQKERCSAVRGLNSPFWTLVTNAALKTDLSSL